MNGYNTPGDSPKHEMRKHSEGGKNVAFKKGGSTHEHHGKGKKNDTTHFTDIEKSGDMGKLHTHKKSELKKGDTFYADHHEEHSMMCGGGKVSKK